tara:strand:- start:883 stop:1161 length:279 start_codon:yes stop_codon:yes gene_type:complete
MSTTIAGNPKLFGNMPRPGAGRFWHLAHEPLKKTPVRIELRQKLIKGSEVVLSMSTIVARDYTVADEEAIIEKAKEILARAGRVDEVVGIYT